MDSGQWVEVSGTVTRSRGLVRIDATGITLAKGDVIHLHGDLERSTLEKVKDTPAKKLTHRTMTVTARHLSAITRGKEKLAW